MGGASVDCDLNVVLYQPEIPQNTGNIGRTCVATGTKLWLVRPLGFRLDDHHLKRSGLDYWPHLSWQVVDDWPTLESHLVGHRAWYFTKSAARSYWDVQYQRGDFLVFGNESGGLPDSWLHDRAASTVRIPTTAAVRSLNLANAVSIAVYETQRQARARRLVDAPSRARRSS